MTRISCDEVINLFRQREEIEKKIEYLASDIMYAENEARGKELRLRTYTEDISVKLVEYRGKQVVRVIAYGKYAERHELDCSFEEFANPLLYYERRLND